jgi:lipid-binding SYLF domain-containing protein
VKRTSQLLASLAFLSLAVAAGGVRADEFDDTINIFKNAGESGNYFDNAYGYAVFPTVGKGAIGIGGAHGSGRVYAGGEHVGDTKMTALSIGFQLGGQAFSQIVFFEDQQAFDNFTSGNFEFGANASAVAITAGASAGTSTAGTSSSASAGKNDASTAGAGYRKGMAVFSVAKGGLMYEASVAGQKFSYKAK